MIARLANLVYLNLASNKIASLASLRGLSKLQKLETLILHGNKLAALRNAGKYLAPNLKTLDLGGNLIAELTEVITFVVTNQGTLSEEVAEHTSLVFSFHLY